MPIPNDYEIPINAGSKQEFELLPDDVYEVVISNLDLKKDQPVYQSTEIEDKFAFEFTVVEEGKYKGRKLWLDTRTVMGAGFDGGSPSWLYRIFCAVNSIQLSDTEAKSITANNINGLSGKSLRVVVKQKLSATGKTRNKIVDVMPTKLSLKPLEFDSPVSTPTDDEEISVEDIPF